mgnify:CR=1 FL=1
MLMLSFALLVVISGIDLTLGIGKRIMEMRSGGEDEERPQLREVGAGV